MIEIKQSFLGGLDLDTSFFQLRRDAYVDALNVTRDAVAGNQDLAITNIVGNVNVVYSYPSGAGKVRGAIANTLRNTVIFIRWNENNYHGVYEYNRTTDAITKIFENLTDSASVNILNIPQYAPIANINIYNRDEGDLLFFLDGDGIPTVMNITEFKAGTYTPVTRDILNVGKNPPLSPPDCVYDNDTARRTNNTRNKLFRFKYRWVYDDNYKSTFSPISSLPLPVQILSNTYTNEVTNNNVIQLSINSGNKEVKAVEIAMSYVNRTNSWSDFQSVETVNKADQSIADDTDFNYSFYNDSTYPTIDINESILDFDRVPDIAKSQEMPNGNVLTYGGITEGYDRTLSSNVTLTINTVAAGSGSVIGTLNATYTIGGFTFLTILKITFSGIPATGTVVTVKLKRLSDNVVLTAATYTTVSGDTSAIVASNLVPSGVSIGIFSSSLNPSSSQFWGIYDGVQYEFSSITITPPSSSATVDSIPTWPFSTERNIGLVYFDKKGKTNGVLYNSKITFPAYAENGSAQVLLPYINAKIYHVPPDWAYSYQWVFTKEPTQWLFWHTTDVNTTETDYLYFDVSNIALNAEKTPTVADVLSYSFQDGDRLRLIRRMSDGTVYGDTYDAAIEGLVVSPTINNVVTAGTFIKIKKVTPFSTVTYTSKFFIIQIYRPGQPLPNGANQVFYELGEQYPILNPTESTRVHGGEVTNQSTDYVTPAEFNFYEGDSYFRVRNVFISSTGQGTFNVQDRNFVDFYISAVSSIDGRPSAIELNARRAYYHNLIRFGQAYQPNTNVNGLNRFYPNDFLEVDYSFGDIMRMKVRDRVMRVFQKLKVGEIPLFSQINKDAAGNTVQVVTDQLLNPIRYYVGDYGIGDASASLASFNFADYFADTNKGAICRVSSNGVEPLSVLYKVNSWTTDHIPLRTGNYNIYGSYDQKVNNYIVSLEATASEDPYTLSFDEETNVFESFLSYHPETMVTLGTLLITFKNGELWRHNNSNYNSFYGTLYPSYVLPVFNDIALQKKSWQSVSEIANTIWSCPQIYTNVMSYGTQRQESSLIDADFEVLEGNPSASFYRDNYSIGGLINGDQLKGNYIAIKFYKNNPSDLVYLSSILIKYADSPLTVK